MLSAKGKKAILPSDHVFSRLIDLLIAHIGAAIQEVVRKTFMRNPDNSTKVRIVGEEKRKK